MILSAIFSSETRSLPNFPLIDIPKTTKLPGAQSCRFGLFDAHS